MFNVLKESTGMAGQQCGGRVNRCTFCVTVSGQGEFRKADTGRVGGQTVNLGFPVTQGIQENGHLVSVYMTLSFAIIVEKEKSHQTHGRVNVVDKRSWRIKKLLQRLAKVLF